MKESLIERYEPVQGLKDVIRDAMSVRLSSNDIRGLISTMDHLFEKANFNADAQFGVLGCAAMEHLYLARFTI